MHNTEKIQALRAKVNDSASTKAEKESALAMIKKLKSKTKTDPIKWYWVKIPLNAFDHKDYLRIQNKLISLGCIMKANKAGEYCWITKDKKLADLIAEKLIFMALETSFQKQKNSKAVYNLRKKEKERKKQKERKRKIKQRILIWGFILVFFLLFINSFV